MFGLGLALLAEARDKSIKSAADVLSITDLPVLASIPLASKKQQVGLPFATHRDPEGMYADGYHKVRSSLEFVSFEKDIKTVLITSPNPAEGKSTTSANLALALASVGKRTVLLDVDYRRPRIHQIFGGSSHRSGDEGLVGGVHHLGVGARPLSSLLRRQPMGDPYVCDGNGWAEAMLGLNGFAVLDVAEAGGELRVTVETEALVVGCSWCGVRAEPQDRMLVVYRDLECFGRPVRLVWRKRRWRCRETGCDAKTWSEVHEGFGSRVLLTRRAGVEVTVAVGRDARPVSGQAERFGVAWETIQRAVEEYGGPLVDDPTRVGAVAKLGVDETSYLRATPTRSTLYATGMIDLDRRIVVDMIEGRQGADLRRWLLSQPGAWLEAVKVVATDLADAYRSGMKGLLDHALKVADGFHVVRVANRCLDAVRRRVQQEMFGHRGRKDDPLYRARKILLTGNERLNDSGRDRLLEGLRLGDPHDEVLGAWLAKEQVRDLYLTDEINLATVLIDRTIKACLADDVGEIRSLGRTLKKWRTEILNHHRTGASNGPTEGMNLCIKKVKRAGHGFRCFDHYRLRVLLHAGGCDWNRLTNPARPIRTRHSPLK